CRGHHTVRIFWAPCIQSTHTHCAGEGIEICVLPCKVKQIVALRTIEEHVQVKILVGGIETQGIDEVWVWVADDSSVKAVDYTVRGAIRTGYILIFKSTDSCSVVGWIVSDIFFTLIDAYDFI